MAVLVCAAWGALSCPQWNKVHRSLVKIAEVFGPEPGHPAVDEGGEDCLLRLLEVVVRQAILAHAGDGRRLHQSIPLQRDVAVAGVGPCARGQGPGTGSTWVIRSAEVVGCPVTSSQDTNERALPTASICCRNDRAVHPPARSSFAQNERAAWVVDRRSCG